MYFLIYPDMVELGRHSGLRRKVSTYRSRGSTCIYDKKSADRDVVPVRVWVSGPLNIKFLIHPFNIVEKLKMEKSTFEQLNEIYLEESLNAGVKRLLAKYPPIDLTIPGNAIPNGWDWDLEEDNIYDEI